MGKLLLQGLLKLPYPKFLWLATEGELQSELRKVRACAGRYRDCGRCVGYCSATDNGYGDER